VTSDGFSKLKLKTTMKNLLENDELEVEVELLRALMRYYWIIGVDCII
jgi:hypothetical protein